jgi:predicted anti-sigma-YlaC factor YlaD
MKCIEASEFLPWLVNGSLSAEESDRVKRHLATCADCRRELTETAAAFEIFDEHLPAEVLIGLAFGEPAGSTAAELHLTSCEICADRLALVRESRGELARAESEESSPPVSGEPRPREYVPAGQARWRSLAMAASVAAMIAATGWIWSWQSAGRSPATFRGTAPATGGASAAEPLLNVAVATLAPDRLAGLETDGQAPARVPLEAAGVTLVLESDLASDVPVSCRLAAADGSVVWSRDGLERRPEGGYALSVPTAGLGAGRYVLSLLDDDGYELESYSIELR